MNPIRLLIVDDHELARLGNASVFTPTTGIEVIAMANNGSDALTLVEQLQPNMVLMDISMPQMDGFEATERLKAAHPNVYVLLLSMYDSPDMCERFNDSSADGYQLKSIDAKALVESVKAVCNGITVIPDKCREYSRLPISTVLTPRQLEIAKLWARGLQAKQVARHLNISPRGTQKHIENIYQRTNTHNRIELLEFLTKYRLL